MRLPGCGCKNSCAECLFDLCKIHITEGQLTSLKCPDCLNVLSSNDLEAIGDKLASAGFVKKKVFEYVRNSGWGEGRMASTVSFGPELGMKHVGIKGSSNAVMRN